jgi:hypothetical protein
VSLSSRRVIISAKQLMGKAMEHPKFIRLSNISLDCWAVAEGFFTAPASAHGAGVRTNPSGF